ncbi:pseudouridine synthase [Dacryopinax primogenitus]|uniref:Pseudouridine synthase n=1 Tax=Dacryopinax primogenitus (strain DJM 731) TaxID=1858805 RepID=M5FPF1_DACPD|nr:pseudouridine synthase [Dacryopinax primogenitus]EJT97028.1 pseudouridine synthase [Dacryopinax primogenitus]
MAKGRWWNREILELISTEFRDRSLEYYRFALAAGVTTINGRRAKPGDIVRNGDRIQNVVHKHEPPVTGRVQVISGEKERERDLIVVMKPGSVPVHAAGRYYKNSLLEIIKSDFGLDKVYTVNRLDRLTSGLMLIATTPQRASELCKQFAENKVQKSYLARVAGKFPDGETTVSEPLLTIDRQMGLVVVHPSGKPSLTHFRLLSYSARTNTSLLLCQPRTGRTHQIRVHLQWLGFPIANDPVYRDENVWGKKGGRGGIDLSPAARALGLERGGKVDGLQPEVGEGGVGPGKPASDIYDLEPANPTNGLPLAPSREAVNGVQSHSSIPAPALLPRETGADIGLSSPVPLSPQAIQIIKSLRDQKDKSEDWARWRDVVFRARDAGGFLTAKGAKAVGLTQRKGDETAAVEDQDAEGEGAEEEPFHPMLDTATNTLFCPICYAPLHPDPNPEKMYIFLHAWRYETEEGCWESEWPEWAKEGWVPEGMHGEDGEAQAEVDEAKGGQEERSLYQLADSCAAALQLGDLKDSGLL